jgi:hypothetical protein
MGFVVEKVVLGRFISETCHLHLPFIISLVLHTYLNRAELAHYTSRLQAGQPGFDSRQGKIRLFSITSMPALGRTQPPVQCVPGALLFRVKLQGHEADHRIHLVLRSVMVELYIQALYVFMTWCLIN